MRRFRSGRMGEAGIGIIRGASNQALRQAWLMRWLPARGYDNGLCYAFTNPIGYDGGQLKKGNAMILDPYGEGLDF